MSRRNDLQVGIIVSALLTIAWIALTWRYGFDIADEGFYWYGAQRMLHGEIPMRDYMAYDIGRYAWSAAVMLLIGDDGIVGARIASAVYQVCTIMVGVLLALRALDRKTGTALKILFAALVTLLLNLWVHPYYKVFDYGTSLLIVAMLSLMFASRDRRRWFLAGTILGFAAVMGRNHGIYGAFAGSILLGFLWIKQGNAPGLFKPVLAFIAGTIVGFSPTFALALLVDGFAVAFIQSVRDLLSAGSTNFGLPIPWPWTPNRAELGWLMWGMEVITGLCFVALLVVPVVAVVALARKPISHFRPFESLALCAAFSGFAYAHYAYSRADLTHLALGIAPLILILVSAGVAMGRPILASLALAGMSILALTPEKPFLAQFLLQKPLAAMSINGSILYVFPGIDRFLQQMDSVLGATYGTRKNFLAVPNAPTLYAIYKQKMPIWEIYSLWPRAAAFEAQEIERLEAAMPEVVLLSNHALDNQEALRYSSTHPVLYKWVVDHYSPDATALSYQSWKVMRIRP